jgi:dipeptidyl aminopeptidase/acylaminoacyl peptidase
VGWHYGGYAAVQAAVTDPDLFKAIVAIAPITDLTLFKDELHGWSNASLRKESVGNGPNMHSGSPIEHVDRITAPVLLFHGELDRDVSVEQSKRLAARLTAAGKACKLVTWPDLDDDLVDSGARAEMLRTSDQFMRQALGLGADLAGTAPGARSPE